MLIKIRQVRFNRLVNTYMLPGQKGIDLTHREKRDSNFGPKSRSNKICQRHPNSNITNNSMSCLLCLNASGRHEILYSFSLAYLLRLWGRFSLSGNQIETKLRCLVDIPRRSLRCFGLFSSWSAEESVRLIARPACTKTQFLGQSKHARHFWVQSLLGSVACIARKMRFL